MSSRPYNGPSGYLPNGAPGAHAANYHAAQPLLPNQGRVIEHGPVRVLCIADIRGNLRSLNELAKQARAQHIIHTGDFGFYDESSLDRIADKTLKHVAQYSPLIPDHVKKAIVQGVSGPVKQRFSQQDLPLSELSMLIKGHIKLQIPVYTVWGACEDVRVLEKFRSGEYKVHNLHIIDEARSMLLEIGGVKLRLLGLGGAVVMHKLFDNGEGRTTIAGGQGTMWTTLLQMGELVDTANRVFDPTETRVFVTHASPAREGILNQLTVSLKSDFSISAGLHFRYGSSYNEFSVNPSLDHYRGKLAASKASFNDVWDTVKSEVEPVISQNEAQQNLLRNALTLVEKMPTSAAGGNPFGGSAAGAPVGYVDESAFKNMWNFNLADAAFGYLVLEVQDGRIGTEMRAQGFNFAHRGARQQSNQTSASTSFAPVNSGQPPTGPASSARAPSMGPGSQRAPSVPHNKPSAVVPVHPKPATPKPATTASPSAAPVSKENEKPSAANGNGTSHGPGSGNGHRSGSGNGHRSGSGNGRRSGSGHRRASGSGNGNGHGTASGIGRDSASSTADVFGLFVMNTTNEEQVRGIFPEELRRKITKVDKWGQYNRVVHFANAEDRDATFANLPNQYKMRHGEDRSKPLVKVFVPPQSGVKSYNNHRGGAGTWGSRGNPNAGPGGYRGADRDANAISGGDSGPESGRRGGRGGRGRGGDRGRGRGGGRGGIKDSGGSPARAAAPSAAGPATE